MRIGAVILPDARWSEPEHKWQRARPRAAGWACSSRRPTFRHPVPFMRELLALDGLLTVDGFDHRGTYFEAHGVRNLPGSVRRPRPDFVIAATGPRGMRLAARHGVGWATTGRPTDGAEAWWRGIADIAARFEEVTEGAELDRCRHEAVLEQIAAARSSLATCATSASATTPSASGSC